MTVGHTIECPVCGGDAVCLRVDDEQGAAVRNFRCRGECRFGGHQIVENGQVTGAGGPLFDEDLHPDDGRKLVTDGSGFTDGELVTDGGQYHGVSVASVTVTRNGEEPYNGDPFGPHRIEVKVRIRDGEYSFTHDVKYTMDGSTAVFRTTHADDAVSGITKKSLTAALTADDVVRELPFVQAVESIGEQIQEVQADE